MIRNTPRPAPGKLSSTPAWPFMAVPTKVVRNPISAFTAPGGRLRVFEYEDGFFTSVDGSNLCGPHKTFERAEAYGTNLIEGI